MRRIRLLPLLAGFAACTLPVQAATTCTASNLAMSLGTYALNATPLDSSAVLVVSCARSGGPATTTVTVGIGPSLNTGGVMNRALKLATGSDLLAYNLYRDAGRTLVWGNAVGGNTVGQQVTLGNNASGTLTFTIFGRIDALQDVRAGAYADALTLTITF